MIRKKRLERPRPWPPSEEEGKDDITLHLLLSPHRMYSRGTHVAGEEYIKYKEANNTKYKEAGEEFIMLLIFVQR